MAVARVLLMARGHAPGFVHRDISARNIMLRGTTDIIRQQIEELDPSVCLIDMGSSLVSAADRTSFTLGSDIWRYGTPEYAAPEMLARDDDLVARRSSYSIDVYALCSVLYELYAGYAPYDMQHSRTLLDMSAYEMKDQFAPISVELHVADDRPLVELLMGGIVADQARRIELEELYDGLRRYLGAPGMTSDQLRQAGERIARPVPGQVDARDVDCGGGRVTGPLPERLTSAMEAPPGMMRRSLRELFG